MVLPERWGPHGENIVYTEILDDGEARARMWWAESGEEQEAMERFWEACLRVDWDKIAIHPVNS